jgi:hypothetical protein
MCRRGRGGGEELVLAPTQCDGRPSVCLAGGGQESGGGGGEVGVVCARLSPFAFGVGARRDREGEKRRRRRRPPSLLPPLSPLLLSSPSPRKEPNSPTARLSRERNGSQATASSPSLTPATQVAQQPQQNTETQTRTRRAQEKVDTLLSSCRSALSRARADAHKRPQVSASGARRVKGRRARSRRVLGGGGRRALGGKRTRALPRVPRARA